MPDVMHCSFDAAVLYDCIGLVTGSQAVGRPLRLDVDKIIHISLWASWPSACDINYCARFSQQVANVDQDQATSLSLTHVITKSHE